MRYRPSIFRAALGVLPLAHTALAREVRSRAAAGFHPENLPDGVAPSVALILGSLGAHKVHKTVKFRMVAVTAGPGAGSEFSPQAALRVQAKA